MSLYCKGEICDRREQCAYVESWEEFPYKDLPEGFEYGIWYVNETECMSNNYSEGVLRETYKHMKEDKE